jgi:hypothetical protein
MESCDEAIGKENDHLKLEVNILELEVNKLKKQVKVQYHQDSRRNMVKKLEKRTTAPKLISQQQNKPTHYKKKRRIVWMKRHSMQEVHT